MGLVGIMLIVFAGVIIMLAQQNSDNKPLEDGD